MKAIFLTLILSVVSIVGLSFSAHAKSRILVISDIDDTLKLSNVRSTLNKGINAFIDYQAFLGMTDLYQAIALQPSTSLYYVSNAPSFLMHSRHTKFLNQFLFPQSQNVLTRKDAGNDNFKVETILNLVNQEQPEVVILIGDNGEHDPRVFQTVRAALASQQVYILSFVHIVYANGDSDDEPADPLTSEELPFVTPIEVGLQLSRFGIIPPTLFQSVALKVIPQILTDARMPVNSRSFPEWKDCTGYDWSIPTRGDEPQGTDELKRLVKKRCGVNFNVENFYQITSLEYPPDLSEEKREDQH